MLKEVQEIWVLLDVDRMLECLRRLVSLMITMQRSILRRISTEIAGDRIGSVSSRSWVGERNLVISSILFAREFPLSRYFSERLMVEGGSAMNAAVRVLELRISLTAAD